MKKNIKIAFIGNMNNNNFAFARYLRVAGWDVTLFLTDFELEQFDPCADTFDKSYLQYTKKLDWGSPDSFQNTTREKIRQDLENYDVYIATGLVPAYMHKAGLRIDIFIPHGADIAVWTKYKTTRPKNIIKYNLFVWHQRAGLSEVKIIHTGALSVHENIIKKLFKRSELWLTPVPMFYLPEYINIELKTDNELKFKNKYDRIRGVANLMIISPSRINKNTGNGVSGKGIDVLLDSLSYLSAEELSKIKIILFEYGRNVDEIKEIIVSKGLGNVFEWLPKMERKEIMYGLYKSDVVLGQFGPYKWSLNGVITEALAIGKPIITSSDSEDDKNENKHWMLSANNAIEISVQIKKCVANIDEISNDLKKKNDGWYESKVNKAIAKYEDFFYKIIDANN